MPTITPYENTEGEQMVSVVYEDGTIWSGYKSAYDAMQAEQSTPIVPTDNYLTPPDTMESTQPDEADLTEGTN